MKVSDFDYDLPTELIAQRPALRRDDSRMIVLSRGTGDVRETRFVNFPRYLQDGDVLVLNETKVIAARVFGRRLSGGAVEVFLTRRLGGGQWSALLRPSRRISPGERVLVGDNGLAIRIEERMIDGEWRVSLPRSLPEREFIAEYGHVPLPPYIKRPDEPADRDRYQTVFARTEGSVAAPTAGLHFTEELLHRITTKGAAILALTLHVGSGTFRPLADEVVERNTLPPEYLIIRKDYWDELRRAKESGRRIIAVGTTVTRALESLAAGRIRSREERRSAGDTYITGWADLFIYPGFTFRVVDALLTNLHLPRSSLLMLTAAFTGWQRLLKTYRWAIQRRFRFYSYGDTMFIR